MKKVWTLISPLSLFNTHTACVANRLTTYRHSCLAGYLHLHACIAFSGLLSNNNPCLFNCQSCAALHLLWLLKFRLLPPKLYVLLHELKFNCLSFHALHRKALLSMMASAAKFKVVGMSIRMRVEKECSTTCKRLRA